MAFWQSLGCDTDPAPWHQEAAPMVLAAAATVKSTPRFLTPPWDRSSPEWLAIDAALPADHPARALRASLDRLDLTALEASCATTGSKAYHPALMLAIALGELNDGRNSPAQWARDARLHDELKWLGFGIRPSRSRCYIFRDRMAGRLPELFQQVFEIARESELTPATRAALDGTAIAACASRHRLLNRATLCKRLGQLALACAADARPDHPGAAPRPTWMANTPQGRAGQRRSYRDALEVLEERIALNDRRPPSERRDPAKIVISPGEPEAVLGLDKLRVFRPLYNAQLAYDLDSELVLGYGVFALPTDIGTLGPMLATVHALTGTRLSAMLADAKYANMIDITICEQEGVTLYAPEGNDASPAKSKAKSKSKAKPKAELLPKSAFTWDAQRREYRCPEGHSLPQATSVEEERAGGVVAYDIYRCPGETCRACPLRAGCTTSAKGRTVSRAQGEERIEELRRRMAAAEGKALYRRRRETVERGFADLRRHRSMDRFHGRGLERAMAELGLQVLAHNLRVLARHQRSREAAQLAC
jgi:transposase